MNWGTEPPSLDPGLATDVTSANILLNIMDPLVKLDEDLKPVPNAAESFETSEDGKTVTFVLRDDLKWTNGDPVTAQDFEYSWKRTVSPELGADYAYQFYGIVGRAGLQRLRSQEGRLRSAGRQDGRQGSRRQDARGQADDAAAVVHAAGRAPLVPARSTRRPWSSSATSGPRPANIVTNGPFKLERWQHNSNIDIVKWDPNWRDADSVKLTRVNGRMITDGITAMQAFEAGEVDVNNQPPAPDEIARLKDTPEYQQYTGLGTYYYGVNVKNITDVKQRRAMALAIPRQSIIDNIAQADQLPADGLHAEGHAGLRRDQPALAVAARGGRHGAGEDS